MWQRFTERARRIILLGQQEAATMQSGYVGTEHLLLGLMRENEGVAAQILQKMGISMQAVREEIEKESKPVDNVSSSEAKLTPTAKHVLELAADESRRMRHNFIGTEHLLIALLRDKDTLAAAVLRRLGLNLEKARTQVMDYLGPDAPNPRLQPAPAPAEEPASPPPLSSIPIEVVEVFNRFFTPDAMALLNRAAIECNKSAGSRVSLDHLILAMLSEENAAALRRKLSGG